MNAPFSSLDSPPPRKATSAFTLVEVVIAIGIISTVLIALVGILPVGVSTVQKAKNLSIEARIAHNIIGEVQLSDWENLQQFNGETRYFDDQATELDNGVADPRQVYSALIEIPEQDPTIPGARPNPNLRRVIVKVTDRPGDQNLNVPSDPRLFRTFATMVVRTDR